MFRYHQDGSLDSGFGVNGKAVLSIPGSYSGLSLQPDGKIILVGTATFPNPDPFVSDDLAFAVARLNSDGSLDTTFSEDGRLTTLIPYPVPAPIRATLSFARTAVVQPDGKIIVAGSAGTYYGSNSFPQIQRAFALARYNSDGSLDLSFSGDGTVVSTGSAWDMSVSRVYLQPDGKVVTVGYVNTTQGPTWVQVHRFNSNGSPDPSFGSAGTVELQTQSFNRADIALHADGRLTVSGGEAMHRLLADGTPDTGFGGDGNISTPSDGGNLGTTAPILS